MEVMVAPPYQPPEEVEASCADAVQYYDWQPGDECQAYWQDDDKWYAARIKRVYIESYEYDVSEVIS